MGGAQAIAALAYGTETVRAGGRDRRARQRLRAGGQAPGRRRSSASTASRARASWSWSPTATPTPSWSRSTCWRRPSTARTARSWLISPDAELLDAVVRPRRAPGAASGRAVADAPLGAACDVADARGAVALADAIAPEHLELVGAEAEALAERVRARRLRVRRARRRHGLRRLRRRLQPRAADRRRRALRRRARRRRRSGAGMARVSLPGEARGAPRAARRSARPRRGLPRARRVDGAPRDEPHRTSISPQPPDETDIQLSLDARRLRRGRARRPASASSTTCSTCSRATARLDLDVEAQGDLETGATTRSRTSASCSARRSTRRSATAAGSRRYGDAIVPMDEARARLRDRHLAAGRYCAFEAELPPSAIGGFDTELAEEFFRAVANSAKLTLHVRRRGGHERPPHGRGLLQGVRARAARRRSRSTRARPACRRRRGCCERRPRSRSSTTAWATCARSRRRSSASAREPS